MTLLHTLKTYGKEGWSDKFSIKRVSQLNLSFSGELLCGCRIVIPASLRADILNKLHGDYLGITNAGRGPSNLFGDQALAKT